MIHLARTFHKWISEIRAPFGKPNGWRDPDKMHRKKNADMTFLILHAGGHLLLYSILGISHILPWPGNRRHSKPWLVNTSWLGCKGTVLCWKLNFFSSFFLFLCSFFLLFSISCIIWAHIFTVLRSLFATPTYSPETVNRGGWSVPAVQMSDSVRYSPLLGRLTR